MSFEEIEHTADRAVRVQGRNFAELLENAARAMSSLDPLRPSGEPSAVRTIEVEGIDREALLVNWLNEILYLEQTPGEVYDRFQILESSNRHLHAQLDGRQSEGGRVTTARRHSASPVLPRALTLVRRTLATRLSHPG